MMKFIFLLFLLPTLAGADELKLMTWNVYMLPKPIKNSHQKTRTHAIAENLLNSDYDVIFLQEAFSGYFRRTLKEKLRAKYPYYHKTKKKFGIYPFMGPGLVAFSRYPMKKVDHVYYKDCTGPDCYASKAVQLVEITLPSGKTLQVANTHLQAGQSQEKQDIRKSQLNQIREFLLENKKSGTPQLLVGDLNIDAMKGEEFAVSLNTLAMKVGFDEAEIEPDKPIRERLANFFTAGFLANCLKEDEDHNPKLLDHVLYIDYDKRLTFKHDEVANPEFILKGKSCPLSDHKPRVVTLQLR